jgi:hypothetical protein
MLYAVAAVTGGWVEVASGLLALVAAWNAVCAIFSILLPTESGKWVRGGRNDY